MGQKTGMRPWCILLFSLFTVGVAAADPPAGYELVRGGSSTWGFAPSGAYTVRDAAGNVYNAQVVVSTSEPSEYRFFMTDREEKPVRGTALHEQLAIAALVAHLDRAGMLAEELEQSRELLRRAAVGITAYESGKLLTELASMAGGVLWNLVATKRVDAAAAGVAELGREVAAGVLRQIAKQFSREELVIRGAIQAAAGIKAALRDFALHEITRSLTAVTGAQEILNAAEGTLEPKDAGTVYEAWELSRTAGLPAIVLWDEVTEPAGLIQTATLIAGNFGSGAGIPVDKLFAALQASIGEDDHMARAIGSYEQQRRRNALPYEYYRQAMSMVPSVRDGAGERPMRYTATARGGYSRSGSYAGPDATGGRELLWSAGSAGRPLYGPGAPVYRDGVLYYVASAMSENGGSNVHAVTALTGDEIWRTPIPYEKHSFFSTPSVDAEHVYAAFPGGIAVLSRGDGEMIAYFGFPERAEGAPLLHDGRIYVMGSYTVYALELPPAASGAGTAVELREAWRFEHGGRVGKLAIHGELALHGEKVIVHGEKLYALDAATGDILWGVDAGASSLDAGPAVYGDTIYPASMGRNAAVAADSGRLLWTRSVNSHSMTAVDEHRLYRIVTASSERDSWSHFYLAAYDRRNGEEKWRTDLFTILGASAPTVMGERVYVATRDGRLFAIDAASGRRTWTFSFEGQVDESAAPLAVGEVVYQSVLDETGMLAVAQEIEPGPRPESFPAEGYINATRLRLRGGPGSNREIVSVLDFSEPVTIVGRSERVDRIGEMSDYWYQLQSADGREGWSYGHFVSVQPTTDPMSESGQKRESAARSYGVGERGPAGGVVFYDKGAYSDGWRYLEAAPRDFPQPVRWGPRGEIGGTAEELGAGRTNSERLLSSSARGNSAASAASRYSVGEFSDWFLPSAAELFLMKTELKKRGLGAFENGFYWSSTELSGCAARAGNFSPYPAGHQGNDCESPLNKAREHHVRPVRSF